MPSCFATTIEHIWREYSRTVFSGVSKYYNTRNVCQSSVYECKRWTTVLATNLALYQYMLCNSNVTSTNIEDLMYLFWSGFYPSRPSYCYIPAWLCLQVTRSCRRHLKYQSSTTKHSASIKCECTSTTFCNIRLVMKCTKLMYRLWNIVWTDSWRTLERAIHHNVPLSIILEQNNIFEGICGKHLTVFQKLISFSVLQVATLVLENSLSLF